jgi:hypothetical protein
MTTDPHVAAARMWLAIARDRGLQVTTYGGHLYVTGDCAHQEQAFVTMLPC